MPLGVAIDVIGRRSDGAGAKKFSLGFFSMALGESMKLREGQVPETCLT
jgi:hypothetical protein